MNQILVDNLKGISSASVEKYLELTGWCRIPDIANQRIKVFYLKTDPDFRLAIPSSVKNADYYLRLYDIIETLSELQGRETKDIIHLLKGTYSDRIQFRILADYADSGKIPLSFAAQFMEGLHDLVLYAACAEEKAQPVCFRAFNSAKYSLQRFQFGQTAFGSFIFNLDVPVASEKLEQYFMEGALPVLPEPAEHKVVKRIRTAFEQVDSIAKEKVKLSDIIDTAYEDGMTANICEAILKLNPNGSEEAALETTFHYAGALTQSVGEDIKCRFERTHFRYADEVSRRYRDKALFEDVDLLGRIVMLSREDNSTEKAPENTVRMEATLDGTTRNITLRLSPKNHVLACNAYRDGKAVRVIGTLDKSGRYWVFEKIRSFTVEG